MAPPIEADGLGFTYRARKSGEVAISRGGRVVTILRGASAHAFCAHMAELDGNGQQQAMARITGQYRRGSERTATRHPRNG
jgi:hypothetical protein